MIRKIVLISLAAIILALSYVGGTLAWLTSVADSVSNSFEAGRVSCAVDEAVSGSVKQYVRIQNTGNVPAYIRVMLIPIWRSADGSGTGLEAPMPGTVNPGNWTFSEGIWYYGQAVPAGGYTDSLIENFEMPYRDGMVYELQILASAIQADGMGAEDAADAFGKAAVN